MYREIVTQINTTHEKSISNEDPKCYKSSISEGTKIGSGKNRIDRLFY